jgi:hypothetical protein
MFIKRISSHVEDFMWISYEKKNDMLGFGVKNYWEAAKLY